MPKPYSEDLRSRVAEAVAADNTVWAVALQYKVSPAFVCRMHALWRETGAVQGKPFGGYKRSRLEPVLSQSLSGWAIIANLGIKSPDDQF